MSNLFSPTPFGPGLSPTDISQVANDNFYRLQATLNEISGNDGWIANALPAVSTVTANGNRSYDITFSEDVSTVLSPGMRLKTTRTVSAPKQCTSLNGTSQYWSKSSPAGITFTGNWAASAWVKYTSYSSGLGAGIVERDSAAGTASGWGLQTNTTGQVIAYWRNASGASTVTSYQSIPLNKWVHVAVSVNVGTPSSSVILIDGVSVPFATSSTATTVVQPTTSLTIGNRNSGSGYLAGKVAQAALFSTNISASTLISYMSQGLSGSETSLISAYSFNGNANDLNTTNANNLTASGSAVATNADSPFAVNGSGTPTGTDDFAIVQAVSSTVATVSVPAGCTVPTSGGIAATYISTTQNPFNWVIDNDRWEILTRNRTLMTQTSPVNGTWYNISSLYLNVPKGVWNLGYINNFHGNAGSSITVKVFTTLSTSSSAESDRRYTVDAESGPVTSCTGSANIFNTLTLSAATTYYIITSAQGASHNAVYNLGDRAEVAIKALPAGL
jgi:hypothetical protein